MQNIPDISKRSWLKGALAVGVGAVGAELAAMSSARPAVAQLLDTGIDPKSVLAKMGAGQTLQVGYAQTPLWFFKDPKTGELRGVYKDLVEMLAQDLEMKVNWQEVSFADSTVGLRKGDFDLFGSSAVYTVPRSLVADYVGPLWSKGSLALVRREDAEKYKTIADLNSPDVTFSVSAGASEEQRIPLLFPKAKVIAITGQEVMAAEPVRSGRATAFVAGDSDIIVLASHNADWAQIVDVDHPFDKRPNTWMIRYGDPAWRSFLDTWIGYVIGNGTVERVYNQYLQQLT